MFSFKIFNETTFVAQSDDSFKIKNFLFKVKEKVILNYLMPTQKLYEAERTVERASSFIANRILVFASPTGL